MEFFLFRCDDLCVYKRFTCKKSQGAEHRNICHAFGLMAQNALITEELS